MALSLAAVHENPIRVIFAISMLELWSLVMVPSFEEQVGEVVM